MTRILLVALLASLPLAAQAQVDTKSKAAKTCVKNVAKHFGVPTTEVAIYDSLQSEAATVIFVTVGSKSGAWKCFVTPSGKFEALETVED